MLIRQEQEQLIISLTKKDTHLRIKVTEDVNEILVYTNNEDNDIRLAAASQLCPCKVVRRFDDPDSRISSPIRLQIEVMEALEKFNRDSHSEIIRLAHKVLAKAQKGTWNIL